MFGHWQSKTLWCVDVEVQETWSLPTRVGMNQFADFGLSNKSTPTGHKGLEHPVLNNFSLQHGCVTHSKSTLYFWQNMIM